jgi:hypothetical protein
MTTITTPAAVIFRVWTDECAAPGDNVIALFPYEPFNNGAELCVSYEHTGQHGSASLARVIEHSRPATADEYMPLIRELTAAPYGYQLTVLTRVHPRFAARVRARRLRQRQAAG